MLQDGGMRLLMLLFIDLRFLLAAAAGASNSDPFASHTPITPKVTQHIIGKHPPHIRKRSKVLARQTTKQQPNRRKRKTIRNAHAKDAMFNTDQILNTTLKFLDFRRV